MSKYKIFLLILLVLFVFGLFYALKQFGFDIGKIQAYIKNTGTVAPLIFILIYAIGPIFFMPITPLAVIGGILFGPFWGLLYTLIGVNLGACTTFIISRYLMKDWVDRKSPARVQLIQQKIEKEGWKFVALARITPIFPFNVQNYIFGVTNISLKSFLLASMISLIPGTFAYVYLGYAGKNAVNGGADLYWKLSFAIVFLLLISFLPFIIKKFKKIEA